MLDSTGTRLRLRRPAPAPAPPRLDEAQAAVVGTPAGTGHLLVVGAPGTGKSTTAVETFLARHERGVGGPSVLLVPTRRGAARVRDVVAARLAATSADVVVRTPASFAHAVLRLRAAELHEPPPTLITGPEQDAVLAELIAGHLDGLGAAIGWPSTISADTLVQPAFRAELRDLLMRAAELGLTPAELARRGRRHGRPDWEAAARLLAEYEAVTALGDLTPDRGARYDAARIIDEATIALRRWEQDVPGLPRPRWGTVVVDDYQDSTLATARLLRVLVDDGAELVLLGDPDAGVQGFRGGTPALVGAAQTDAPVGGFGARRVDLTRVWRGDERLREVARRVTARIGTQGVAAHRSAAARPAAPGAAGEGDEAAPGGVEAAVLGSGAQEVAFVARRLREEHLHHGTAWDRMAVVVRSTAQVSTVRRGLATWGVPVSSDAGQGVLRAEPAVRPLLTALRAVVADLGAAEAVELLCSPLGGMDAVSVRGLRRALRAAEIGDGEDAVVAVLMDPTLAQALPAQHRSGPARVSRILAAGRAAVGRPQVGAREVLWELWHASGLAGPWRQRALAGGPGADRADADLDALMALFRAAEQFDERHTGAGPGAFLAHVLAQDLPADSLAARSQRTQAVQVLTPAAASGEEWDVVVVAGLQEDVWPDLRLRDSLLGSRLLVDLEAHRSTAREGALERTVARREVLDDELRMLAVALTRARRRLVVTAVLDLDQRPSAFLELVAGSPESATLVREVPPALDLRGLVAELRAELDRPGDEEAGERRAVAATLLASLARTGVAGADPREWAGLEAPTTAEPLRGEDEPVPVSPSSVGMAEACPLRWALETAGGRGEDSLVQSLGTLVHEIAAELPGGSVEELRAALDARWSTLGVPDGWAGRRTRAEADAMVERLAAYLAAHPGEVDVEVPFRVDVGRARLAGRIDRVEHVPGDASAVRVVDLKTSKNPVSAAEGQVNPQLATYQVAIEAGALGEDARSAGARLVYLGTGSGKATTRTQAPLAEAEEPTWAHDLVARAAESMAGATFTARVGPACPTCPVRTSCPATSEGRRTSA
ncbi:ATP-dependent helicase [Georgenia faecalis]|uniref:ATP-dependent helicase n=1 Tax=Georgenia faecalis TaxID=2483799 RepID=UPI000FDBE41E|nr:ATP-dependent DNA helicase [Georgenia faecalis]